VTVELSVYKQNNIKESKAEIVTWDVSVSEETSESWAFSELVQEELTAA